MTRDPRPRENAVGDSAPRFRFTYRGVTTEGAVMGAGGGMVTMAVFPAYCAASDGMPVIVPISGYVSEVDS